MMVSVGIRDALVVTMVKKFAEPTRAVVWIEALLVEVTPKTVPIKLVWTASKDSDPAQVFIRNQIELASRAVARRGLRRA